MKKIDSLLANNTAAGQGWFKIFYEAYDTTTEKWCTEKLIANNGLLSVTIPADLEGGNYLVRPELLALHNAVNNPPDPQFYVGCAQIFLQSNGTACPNQTVSIPSDEYVNYNMSSMRFNIWVNPLALPYQEFGPPIYKAGNGSATHAPYPANQTQTKGLKPANAILQVANWIGTELPDYNTADACWNVSATCWKRAGECYNSAPPTGSTNCQLWEDKCTNIDNQCNAGNVIGPPDKGKVLTPSPQNLTGGEDHWRNVLV